MVKLYLEEEDVLPCGRILGDEIDQNDETAIFYSGKNEIIKFSTLLEEDQRFNHELRIYEMLGAKDEKVDGIPQVIHVGQFHGANYMVLENCGREIDIDIIHEEDIRTKIIKIIKYIHSCGIVHGDIKPENITQRAGGDVSIIDFDSALIIGETVPFKNVGTYPYYPPEIAGNIKDKIVKEEAEGKNDITPAVDYFMFGMVLLESEKEKPFARQFIAKNDKYQHKKYKKMEMKKFILRNAMPKNRGILQKMLAELPQDRSMV